MCRWCGTVTPGVEEASLPRGTLSRALQGAAGDQANAQAETPREKIRERRVRRTVRKRDDEEEAGPGDGPGSHLKDPGSASEQDGLPSPPQTPLSVTQRRRQGVKERGWRAHPSTHSAWATGTRGLVNFPDLLEQARVAAEGIRPEAQDQGFAPSPRVPTKPRGRLVFPHAIIMKNKQGLSQAG